MAAQPGASRSVLDPFAAELPTFLAVETKVGEGHREPHLGHGGDGDRPEATSSAVARGTGQFCLVKMFHCCYHDVISLPPVYMVICGKCVLIGSLSSLCV